jgi:hypothetical protein
MGEEFVETGIRLCRNNSHGVTFLKDDPHGMIGLSAGELLSVNAQALAESPYYLRRNCHVNIGAKAVKPIFMAMRSMPKILSNEISFQLSSNHIGWHNTACRTLYGIEPVEQVIEVIKRIVQNVAVAMNAKVSKFKYIHAGVSEPFISVTFSPA